MKLSWLKTRFSWIASISKFDDNRGGKVIKRVKPEVRKLCSYLLGIGGEKVAVLINEDLGFYKALVDIGKIIPFKRLRIQGGEERECHSNSASLWLRNQKKYKLVTGFGMSDDNIWRCHSWIITTDGNLIETTIAREIYFGIILNNRIAKKFAEIYVEP